MVCGKIVHQIIAHWVTTFRSSTTRLGQLKLAYLCGGVLLLHPLKQCIAPEWLLDQLSRWNSSMVAQGSCLLAAASEVVSNTGGMLILSKPPYSLATNLYPHSRETKINRVYNRDKSTFQVIQYLDESRNDG